jgi:hypothetical protein
VEIYESRFSAGRMTSYCPTGAISKRPGTDLLEEVKLSYLQKRIYLRAIASKFSRAL